MGSRDKKRPPVALWGVTLALALILSYVEVLLPFNFGIPGIKLGLCNLVVVFLLYRRTAKEALLVSLARILLSGVLFGSGMSLFYSLAGGLASFVVMLLFTKNQRLSPISVSMVGGLCHNGAQLVVAVIFIPQLALVYYLPVLLFSGALTGLVIGVVARELINRIPADLTK